MVQLFIPTLFLLGRKIKMGGEDELLMTKLLIALFWLDRISQTWSCSREEGLLDRVTEHPTHIGLKS